MTAEAGMPQGSAPPADTAEVCNGLTCSGPAGGCAVARDYGGSQCGLTLWLYEQVVSVVVMMSLATICGMCRLLSYACSLKGGDRNFDPIVRGARTCLRGAPVRCLFFVQLGMCLAVSPLTPGGEQDSWNEVTTFEPNLYLHSGPNNEAPIVEYVGPALPSLFIPESDTGPWDWGGHWPEGHVGVEMPDEQTEEADRPYHWNAPVKIYDFQRPDEYTTYWTRTDESVTEVMEAVGENVIDGDEDTFLMPVQPQPFSNMLEVFITSTWVLGLGLVPVLIDLSSYGGGRFLAHLDEPITVACVRRIAGQKWPEGAHIYAGASMQPLAPGEEAVSHFGMLIRVHDPARPVPELLFTEERLRDPSEWAMDTRVSSMPTVPNGRGKVCILGFGAPSYVLDARPVRVSLSMRDRVCAVSGLQPESFLLKPPRGRLHDLAIRGDPVGNFLGVQPWIAQRKIGVFVDARHLGWAFTFCWMRRGEIDIDDFCIVAGIRPPQGWDLQVTGAGGYDADTRRIWCREGDVVMIKVREYRSAPGSGNVDNSSQSRADDAPGTHGPDSASGTSDDDADGATARSRSPRRRGVGVEGEEVDDVILPILQDSHTLLQLAGGHERRSELLHAASELWDRAKCGPSRKHTIDLAKAVGPQSVDLDRPSLGADR